MSLFFRLVLFSSLAVTLSAQSDEGVVTVEELRNPLTRKAARALMNAREHLRTGQRELGLQELRDATRDSMTMPYALSMLGVEHLKTREVDAALHELQEAVRLLPRAENHSNLAYAFYLKVQTERGLEEIRKAMQLDGGQIKTRLVLGMLLLQQGSHDAEAIQNLLVAAPENPGVHLMLAQHYDSTGKAPEAEKERRAYSVTSMSMFAGK